MQPFLFDTDIIIEYLRGNDQAINFFTTFEQEFYTSAITIAELYTGVKGDKEQFELEYFLSLFTIYPITGQIATEAGLLRQTYFSSHGMGLADAVIAATTKAHNARLVSLNRKHFSMLDELVVPYEKQP